MKTATQIVDLDGPVHYADHGGGGPPMLLVHGLGGSHLNWEDVAGRFAAGHRVYAPDLLGFGLTPPAGRGAHLQAQRGLVIRFAREVAGAPVTLVGNSMGGLIAMMTAAHAPDVVDRLVLVDPALPPSSLNGISVASVQRLGMPLVPVAGPAAMRRYLASTTPERQIDETLELLCHDPSRVGPQARSRGAEMLRLRRDMPWAVPAFTEAIRSITLVLARRRGFLRDVVHRVAAPTLLVHGSRDRLVPPSWARAIGRARPDWTVSFLEEVGHVPMIETPDLLAGTITRWLGE